MTVDHFETVFELEFESDWIGVRGESPGFGFEEVLGDLVDAIDVLMVCHAALFFN